MFSQQSIRKILTLAVSALSISANASIPRGLSNYNQSHFIVVANGVYELDLGYIESLISMARTELRISTADYIPTHLHASADESYVAREILAHSLGRLLDRSQSTVARNLRNLEEPIRSEMKVTDSEGQSHQFSFDVNAARAVASLSYSGYIDANLRYQVANQSVDVEFSHQISDDSRVVYNHSEVNSEVRDIVGLRLQW